MTNNLRSPLEDQRGKHDFLIEVANKEKQLWRLIHAKDLLHNDVQELYRKVRSSYEKLILHDYEQAELQDVEYSLWKLHYKHIDEFRKRIKKSSNVELYKTNHIEGFKLFLSEAIEFYQNLFVKARNVSRLPQESSSCRKGGETGFSEAKKMQKCQFLCHRFLVCLGDLVRYREQYEKPDVRKHNWSRAAIHYMEATMIWPDSGNPHNQLAVLATYVGDEFLALYHCIRSLAVKEPFPDARDNLILLLERNRSSCLQSLSSEADFDFSKPSERSITMKSLKSSDDMSYQSTLKDEDNGSLPDNFCSLFIRIISFFFIKSSLNEFPSAFTATVRELDALMALDDAQLKACLESYQHMDFVKTGPFRALQVVSIFIYTLHSLIKTPQIKDFEGMNDKELTVVRQLAMTATFIFMGRFIDRCLKASTLNSCPLLPAVLVFIEWLAIMLDEVEFYGVDEKSSSAMSYLFASFVILLRRIGVNKIKGGSSDGTPLWEDYELRGFAPVASVHESLHFSSQSERINDFEDVTESRAHRIINAAIKISSRSSGSRKWIIYDQLGGKFISAREAEFNDIPDKRDSEKAEYTSSDPKTEVSNGCSFECLEESQKQMEVQNLRASGRSITVEEEEVILFKPLTRYNSAPLSSNSSNPTSPKEREDPSVPSDDCLRRATSLLIAQNQTQGSPLSEQADISNFGYDKSFKHQDHIFKDTGLQPFPDPPISAGPPSLSAWVLDWGSSNNSKEKSYNGVKKHVLSPIEEVASETLCGLSMTETDDSTKTHPFSTTHYSSSPYSAPVPSAPLLPSDAAWVKDVQSNFDGSLNKSETFLYAPHASSSYSNWTATQGPPDCSLSSIPGLTGNFPPQRRMSSSEWLRQYRENCNIERGYNHVRPLSSYFYAPGNLGNFHNDHGASRSDLDQWGYPLASNPTMQTVTGNPSLYPAYPLDYSAMDFQRREKLLYGYQRPSPYVCGAVTDKINEPQPLLQLLKEKEMQLQRDPTLMRGPPYMGN
ncbi:nonsense-mediated mRNA decay factor SMG7-like [Humulus lupulus]|uniref:nonsense-mediated mRNA decay factor SMG7-like n=1 Tax=Humulus lupulus TaxID=3486 RepID=UPI002B418294|nr:nonsense-mediated mRNA decay factor SMG7-like [Humulus lupulus]XP_062095724.1 nonsense-mediated mRNA decay factor SMG7-like [Humulus lupulus]XP_062095725.1 nonsense-mediated mRNA decay factor SMG7-like [Humulus lupulus]XP_062095726.1 nonsense-mediated mRNA decay factor SMG7-like [Humulus lupulus]XP_062095727.1 nonsense-mediated mRNA decay factor SMG7-like [Humulus lupulus]XP_062095728.1 nonsense-mediated mRNA decay factor SMG7-like [Humulus lupulus]